MSLVQSIIQDGRAVLTVNNANIKYADHNQFEISNNSENDVVVVGHDYIYVDHNLSNIYDNPTHKYSCQETHIGINTSDDNTHAVCIL